MSTEHKIQTFDEAINFRLRALYLQSLGATVIYPNQQPRPRVRRHEVWHTIPPFGRHGWGATKGVFANHTHPKDITKGDTWIWSDLHFGHKNIIRFSDRPFPDIPTMDEMLIQNFNQYVKPEDNSIWVGDVAFYQDTVANSILRRCNGYKILVIGNHDFQKKNLKKLHFDEVHVVYNMTIDDHVIAFTHYPMDNLPDGWFNVHGHVHKGKPDQAAKPASNRHFNVNCEFLDYKPINLQDLATVIETKFTFNQDSLEDQFNDEYDK